MRIGFVGRARSGKTTCAAVFARYLGAQGVPVLAIDAAADRRLGAALGLGLGRPSPLGSPWPDGRAGTSTVGGRGGSRIADLDPDGELLARFAVAVLDGVRLLGTDAVGPLLDHLADGEGEYVVLDLAADAYAVGQFARWDMTVLVTEPTRREVGVYHQCAAQATARGVELRVLGNKISDWGHAAWLTEQMGDALVGCFGHSAWVRAAERGVTPIGHRFGAGQRRCAGRGARGAGRAPTRPGQAAPGTAGPGNAASGTAGPGNAASVNAAG